MATKLDKTWHLADNQDALPLTEFEFQLWRVFNGFIKWQEDCHQYVHNQHLTGNELALLHVVRMKDRPKTIYELSRMFNRDDPNNIQYSLGKLVKMKLIEKVKDDSTKKSLSYQITHEGIKNTDAYQEARHDLLLNLFKKSDIRPEEIEQVAKLMNKIRGIYDDASWLAASYRNDEKDYKK